MTTIPEATLAALSGCRVEGSVVILPGLLDRPLYVATNKVLEALGGKWDRKQKGHLFPLEHETLVERIDGALLSGEYTNPKGLDGFFPTPPALVEHLLSLAALDWAGHVLEPSAGTGAIADAMLKRWPGLDLVCVEKDPERAAVLIQKGHQVHHGDFLEFDFDPIYDGIVMNPPFAKQQDVDHVLHAFDLLGRGGRLVAVMAAGVTFRNDRKADAMREVIRHHGWLEVNPPDSFKASGTNVNTVTIVLEKP